jgi:hypothetical protein
MASKLYLDYLAAHVRLSVQLALSGTSRLHRDALAMPGASCAFTRRFYDALCSMPLCRFLQLGGSDAALAAAALSRNVDVRGTVLRVDGGGVAAGAAAAATAAAAFDEELARHVDTTRCRVLSLRSCWTCTPTELELGAANVYAFDGGSQSFESQRNAVLALLPFLAPHFVYVVHGSTRYATAKPGAEAGLRDGGVGIADAFDVAGLCVFVCAKGGGAAAAAPAPSPTCEP